MGEGGGEGRQGERVTIVTVTKPVHRNGHIADNIQNKRRRGGVHVERQVAHYTHDVFHKNDYKLMALTLQTFRHEAHARRTCQSLQTEKQSD